MRSFLLTLVLIARTAHADEPRTPVVVPPAPFAVPQTPPSEAGEQLNESTATWISLGSTLGAYGLFFGGLALGSKLEIARGAAVLGGLLTPIAPMFGHWYAGRYVTRGFATRCAGVPVAFIALLMAVAPGTIDPDHRRNLVIGTASIAAGLWIAGTVDDIVQAPLAVRRHNTRWQVAPYLAPTGAGVVGRF